MTFNDYLSHHGIKGQKWGVENGPPYPLGSDISTGHSLRQIRKFQKMNAKWAKNASDEEIKDNLDKIVTKEQIKILQQKYDKFKQLKNKLDEFHNSKEYKKAYNDAYNATFNWLKENDPDYLNDIIKKNNGSTKKLDAYHDFDTIMDGFWDESVSKFDSKPIVINEAKAFREYANYSKSIVDGIVGRYGNMKYDYYNDLFKYMDKGTISMKIDTALHNKYIYNQ